MTAAWSSSTPVLVPGHGSIATGADVQARWDADRAYLDALQQRVELDDPRLEQDWVRDLHRGNQERSWNGRGADMDVTAMRAHCLAKPGAWADNPWDHEHPVIKVGPREQGKIFAFLGADGVGVKGGPSREVADEWIDRYPDDASVMAYIGRSGWNDLAFAGAIPDDELLEAVDESYRLVVSKLPRKHRPDGWDR